jgi:hypothetical protein
LGPRTRRDTVVSLPSLKESLEIAGYREKETKHGRKVVENPMILFACTGLDLLS